MYLNVRHYEPLKMIVFMDLKEKEEGLPGSPVVKTAFPLQGTQVQSPVGELRSACWVVCPKKKKKPGRKWERSL